MEALTPTRTPAPPRPEPRVRWLARRLAPLAYLPLFLGWYFLLEGRPAAGMIDVSSPLDALIPFDERWIVGYLAWFVYLLGFVAWLYVKDWRAGAEIPRLAFFLIVGMTACLIGYTLWPSTQTLRPEVYPRPGPLTDLVAGLQGFDDPSNVFPSLHVYTSLVVAFCLAASRYVRRRWVKAASWALCLVIAASTCFLKQHSILDAFGAAALFGLVWLAWRAWTRRAWTRRRAGTSPAPASE
ncbi:phosphatase PAP2 family protein [Propioniciclava coleopterorum]|uniref:Phosphatase PAP2 family protein n=1 Tax=Propioniciclava coleopterorum TaxID=2714937 RepID=A0A6G7Y3A0_9ACTN|nr:phosphatase PAP2 family protein [Propioniciclava coleopterorum]QIK71179.1 phosphatase PAP2 family protein [Propioniciclava coleopterorum]